MPRKKRVWQAIKELREGLELPTPGNFHRGWNACARIVLKLLGVPEREPERKGKRNAE